MRIGLLVAFSPVMAAFVFTLFNGGNMFDESSGGGGFLWFLMATLPLGFLMMFIGLILLAVNKLKPKDNIVIHNEGLYGKTWWIKGKEYGL